MSAVPLITQIQRFSVNDGPGFRTNVFVKGCNMRCIWCHNPETIRPQRELFWRSSLCEQCGRCLEACARDAINPPINPELARADDSSYHKIIRARCDMCMKCVDSCVYGALEVIGSELAISDILDEVEQDRPFYENSGGGMNLSGGEPTVFPEFTLQLLEEARARGINSCLDTNGHCNPKTLQPILKNIDVVLYDLKHLDCEEHRKVTGVGNRLVLDNLRGLMEMEKEVWLRIIVIPGLSDSLEYHERMVAFIQTLPTTPQRIDLLPFHNWCEAKYKQLGIADWAFADFQALEPTTVNPALKIYQRAELKATIGGPGFEDAP